MSSSQAPSLEVGGVLGRFELLLPIARGGMAQVWAARPPGTRGFRKLVALKTLHSGASDMRLEDMLLEEAKLASQIVHPNVVATHELGEDEGVLYLVMEWVDGLPLSDITRSAEAGRLPIPIAVQIFAQVCRGLHAAHELRDEADQPLGLVHRDISPQNILIERKGIAKIVDFGVAKATARDAGLTENGELKGKIAYMSPEQISGEKVDRRTDIFALGCVFYLLTTGRHPFRGQTMGETVQNICSPKESEKPSTFFKDYPVELERIIRKAIAKKAHERYESARDLLADLEAAFPTWTQTRTEQAVAEYLESTVGDKLRDRRNQLKRSHEELDVIGPRSGTMRALTLASAIGKQAPSASASGLSQQEIIALQTAKKRFPLQAVAIGILVLCGVIGAQVHFLRARNSTEEVTQVVTSQAVSTPPGSSEPSLVPQPETVDDAIDLASLEAEEDSQQSEKKKNPNRTAVVKRKAPRPSASAPIARTSPTAAAPAPTPTPASSSPSGTPEKVDAWDLDAFGARH